jgi:DNA (cytosine-5)-methyltransferase 1
MRFSKVFRRRRHRVIKAVDFFCGAGGLTRGFLDNGIEIILGIDSDGGCRETYEKNNASIRFREIDIRKLSPPDLEEEIAEIPKGQLMFAACAPCQPFSKQRTVAKNKCQRTLLGFFSKFVEAFA